MAKVNIGFTITGDVWVDEEFLKVYDNDIYGCADFAWTVDDIRVTTNEGVNLDYQIDETVVLETI